MICHHQVPLNPLKISPPLVGGYEGEGEQNLKTLTPTLPHQGGGDM
jgi:hypothetical protein